MARSQQRSHRKVSGGRYRSSRGKRKFELTGFPAQTKLGDTHLKTVRVPGGNYKFKLLACKTINVADAHSKKTAATEILKVVKNPANENLVRRNILTKGCVVETKMGKVRVTSRPGQEGSLQGVLVK